MLTPRAAPEIIEGCVRLGARVDFEIMWRFVSVSYTCMFASYAHVRLERGYLLLPGKRPVGCRTETIGRPNRKIRWTVC
jgi:hypothetical protein